MNPLMGMALQYGPGIAAGIAGAVSGAMGNKPPGSGGMFASGVPGAIQQAGQAIGGAVNTYANAQAQMQANTQAVDPMAHMGMMMDQMKNGGVYDPSGATQTAIRQNALTQQAQGMNLDNKQLNEALKRSYVADSYKGAMGMAQNAVDSYLAGSNQQAAGRQALAATRF